MRLNHNRLGAGKKSGKPFRRFAPVVATIALISMPLFAKAEVKPSPPAKTNTLSIVHAGVETLGESVARRHLIKPAKVKGGKVTGITIMVPLLSKKDSYLVLKLPTAEVDELLKHVSTLPKGERAGVVRDWVIKNQELMLKEYIKSGRKQAFSFNLASIVPTPDKKPEKVDPVPELRRGERTAVELKPTLPIPPKIIGGEGTEKNPIKINVPVPIAKEHLVGTKLYSGKTPLQFGERRIHLSIRFVAVTEPAGSEPRTTTREQLLSEIARVVSGSNQLKLIYTATGNEAKNIGGIRLGGAASGLISEACRKNEAIRHYVPN